MLFSVYKKSILGRAAEVGTFQRIPRLVREGIVREFAYTGRRFVPEEAFKHGLVNKIFDSKEDMMEGVMAVAKDIAYKGPLAIAGTKESLNYGRDHTTEESLNHIALWNNAMGIGDEMSVAFKAKAENKDHEFEDVLVRRRYLDGEIRS
jgi:Enoyl-CoA hydratase/carnithine racemase